MDAHARRRVPSVFPRRLAGEGEAADPDALRFEDHDGAGRELVGDSGEVAEEERCLLLRPPFGASTEQDNRRAINPAGGEKRREIGVGRDENAGLRGGALEDLLVGCRLEAVVANVHRVVTGGRELLGKAWRERVVDEEPQPAASGSSRSCTASAA